MGQSYGAAISTLMAAAQPDKVAALVLLSGLFGDMGPTSARLVELGRRIQGVIPRDLRNAITEVLAQRPQLPIMCEALRQLSMPIHIVHGDQDDFAPISAAQGLAKDLAGMSNVSFTAVPDANHFLNEGPPELVLQLLEAAVAAAREPEPPPSMSARLHAIGQRLLGGLTGLTRRPALRDPKTVRADSAEA